MKRMTTTYVEAVIDITKSYLDLFGYNISRISNDTVDPRGINDRSLSNNISSVNVCRYQIHISSIETTSLTFMNNVKETIGGENKHICSPRNETDVFNTNTKVWINTPFSIRKDNDPFGRLFTETRRSITANDSQPLPTVF
jgi:hypothetical protein